MSIDLSSYSSVGSALFVHINIPDGDDINVSTWYRPVSLGGIPYTGIGQLLQISETTTDLRLTPEEITVAIIGLPVSVSQQVITQNIKGATIAVSRVLFDPTTNAVLEIAGNPMGKFTGIVTNWSITDDVVSERDRSVTITFTASSTLDILTKKIGGRRTNPVDQRFFYPGDASFDRTPALASATINWGVPV